LAWEGQVLAAFAASGWAQWRRRKPDRTANIMNVSFSQARKSATGR
jgi:hypothetical protein